MSPDKLNSIAYFFIIALTLAGVTGWASKLKLRNLGLTMMVGLFAFTLTLYAATDLVGLTLTQASVLMFGLSVIGLWWLPKPKSLNHPLAILPGVAFVWWLIMGAARYFPYQWDEFSHWWMMPKQMWAFESLRSPEFVIRDFLTYTPGWPLLVAYPTLLTRAAFDNHYLIWAPFFMALASACLIFEHLRRHQKLLISWLILLILMRFKSVVPIYPSSLLVEFAQLPVVFAFVYALVFSADFRSAGLLLAFAYLIKAPSLSVLAILPFVSRPRSAKDWAWLIVPVGLVSSIWTLKTLNVAPTWPKDPLVMALTKFFTVETVIVYGRMIWLHVKETWPMMFLIVFAAIAVVRKKPQLKRPILGFGVWWLLIFASVGWLYMTKFSIEERQALSGVDRYLSLPEQVALFALALYAAEAFAVTLSRRSQHILFGIACIMTLEQMHANFHNHTNGHENVFYRESAQLREFIGPEAKPPQVLMLAQGSWKDSWRLVLSQSFVKGGHVFYHVGWHSWLRRMDDQSDENRGASLVTQDTGVYELFDRADIIWPVKLDAWLDGLIRTRVDDSCHGELTQYFLRKDKGTVFHCTAKSLNLSR